MLRIPKLALMLAKAVSAATVLGLLSSQLLCSLLFPEFSTDAVRLGPGQGDNTCNLAYHQRTQHHSDVRAMLIAQKTHRQAQFQCAAGTRALTLFQVWEGHHEGLEHLMHMGFHVNNTKVGRLLVL